MRILATLLSLFLTFLLLITGARFLILLFNANPNNNIVHWILSKSDFWVKPFFNIIDNQHIGTAGFLEPASLIAFVVYLIVGSIILNLLRMADFSSWGGWGGRRLA